MANDEHSGPERLRTRVWGEHQDDGQILLTWADPPNAEQAIDRAAQTRAVAAALQVLRGVEHAQVQDVGVLVAYDADIVKPTELAKAVRGALSLDADLKARAGQLIRRMPTYFSLAKVLALDERISPVPDAARGISQSHQQASGRNLPPAARLVPGLSVVSRVQAVLPVLTALSEWSRDTSPEIVEGHLGAVGLARTDIDRDLATGLEAMSLARDVAGDTAAKALDFAQKARATARVRAKELAQLAAERAKEFADKPDPEEPTE